jgi:hypothetical protein
MTAETETGHRGLNSWWNMMMTPIIAYETAEDVSSVQCVGYSISCEISCSHGGEYEVQNCLLGCIVMSHLWWWRQHAPLKRRSTIILHGSISQKTTLNVILAAVKTLNLTIIKADYRLHIREQSSWKIFLIIPESFFFWIYHSKSQKHSWFLRYYSLLAFKYRLIEFIVTRSDLRNSPTFFKFYKWTCHSNERKDGTIYWQN